MSIRFDHVFYTYYPNTKIAHDALKDINLEIDSNTYTAIIGHTGSGKSTLVQQINALLLPTQGNIMVNEYNIDSKSKIIGIKNLRKQAGMVFQFPEYQLFEETCFKDIAFGPKNFGVKEEEFREKAIELLKLVGLDESYLDVSPFEISGGQKRRVAIAGILALDPSILILDEPTAGLDPKGANEMMELFYKLYKAGKTIILVTHDMNYVLKYADKAVVLKDGEIVEYDEPTKIFENHQKCLENEIDVPICIDFANKLINKGLNINKKNIKDTESLISEILKLKGANHE